MLGAGPDILGLLVAAQSAAWLLVTLPAGAWVDRMPRRTLLLIGLALGLAASVVAVVAAAAGITSLLGVAAFVGASGTVVYMLTSMSLLPSLVPAADLPRSNARLELARAIVSLAAPFVAGLLAQHLSPTWGYALAAVGAAVALACIVALPKAAAPTARRPAAVAWRPPSRPVRASSSATSCCAASACARSSGTSPSSPCSRSGRRWRSACSSSIRPSMGLAQSAYGAGLILGALVAPISSRRLPPLATLIFGPAVSVIAAALFLLAPSGNGFAFAAAGHFLVGFGPMLWLICQTTVRQLVTPAPMLGRVNATVQTAIYGVRPLGALVGGIVAAQAGLQAALLLIAASFVLSTLVIVLSPLARLRTLPQPVAA